MIVLLCYNICSRRRILYKKFVFDLFDFASDYEIIFLNWTKIHYGQILFIVCAGDASC